MNLVDSCDWLEYFANGTNADFFAPAIKETAQLIVPTLCLFEVFKRIMGSLHRKNGLSGPRRVRGTPSRQRRLLLR